MKGKAAVHAKHHYLIFVLGGLKELINICYQRQVPCSGVKSWSSVHLRVLPTISHILFCFCIL